MQLEKSASLAYTDKYSKLKIYPYILDKSSVAIYGKSIDEHINIEDPLPISITTHFTNGNSREFYQKFEGRCNSAFCKPFHSFSNEDMQYIGLLEAGNQTISSLTIKFNGSIIENINDTATRDTSTLSPHVKFSRSSLFNEKAGIKFYLKNKSSKPVITNLKKPQPIIPLDYEITFKDGTVEKGQTNKAFGGPDGIGELIPVGGETSGYTCTNSYVDPIDKISVLCSGYAGSPHGKIIDRPAEDITSVCVSTTKHQTHCTSEPLYNRRSSEE